MEKARHNVARHLAFILGSTAFLVLCIIYPFLPGQYDRLAMPLSMMAQVFGVLGLAFVPIGLLWLMMPKRRFIFAIASVLIGTFVALVLALFATLSVGNSFGILTLVVWVCVVFQLIATLKRLKNVEDVRFHPAPLYLICLPVLTLISQLLLAAPITVWSKERAITNASKFISDIENYRSQHSRYPVSLQAQNKDYYPAVVSIEKYIYVPQSDAYNLSFEQPRFLLDRFGTREWVVYNPRDEHRVYSHVAWLFVPSERMEASQGWYASGDTRFLHWKYFLFD